MGRVKQAKTSVLIAGVLPAAALAVQPVAHAADGAKTTAVPSAHEVTWRDRGNDRYLSVKDGSKKNGARVSTNPTDHNKQQHWRADYKSVSVYGQDLYDMKNVNSGKCLSVGPRVGHEVLWTVVQEPCRHADTWAEYPMYNARNRFQGWLLITNGENIAICADNIHGKTVNSVFGRTGESIVSENHGNHQTQGCIWH
jgi:hypothetical protein